MSCDSITSYYLQETIDFNNDGTDELVFLKIIDADDPLLKTYFVEIYSNKPFPVNSNDIYSNDNSVQLSSFQLQSVYPNPFNNSTNINFYLTKTSQIQISVYDLLGRKIELIEDSIFVPGIYSIPWHATKHSSGVYFIKMCVDKGESTQIIKAMLLK